MYSLPTEPGSIGHTLDAGFKLYVVSFKRVLGLSVLAILSVAVPIILAVVAMIPFLGAGSDPGVGVIALLTVGVIGAMCLYMGFYLAVICRVGSIAYGSDLSVGASASMGMRRLFPVIVASVLYVIAIMLGYVLLIIPGIFLGLNLAFYALCIVLEGDGIIESLKHSHRLMWGHWWRTAIISTVVFVIYYVFSLAIQIPFIVLEQVLATPDLPADGTDEIVQSFAPFASGLLSSLGSFLSAVVTFPLMAAVFVVVFHDLKLRSEGQDLEARVEALTVSA